MTAFDGWLPIGVTWSDGVPFTSDDVLFSVRAIFDPMSESFIADTLNHRIRQLAADLPGFALTDFAIASDSSRPAAGFTTTATCA